MLYLLAVIVEEPAATVPPPSSAPAAVPHLYLKPPPVDCDRSPEADEIVVCANRDPDQKYRLQSVDPTLYVDPPIRAEAKVAGGTLGLTANTADVGGFTSSRMMLTFKIKF